jgi:uncharacterized protein (DUF58 family)
MLTVQGWIVALVAIALVASGRLFAIVELYLLGAGAAALVIGAAVTVWRTRLRLDLDRSVHPPRVHAGGPSRVDLTITNLGRRRSPLLTLQDPVGDSRSASVVVAPLGRGESVRASYRLPTDRRGVVRVGPLAVRIADPFGLAALATPAAPIVDLTIWPAIDEVAPLPHTTGDDPHGGADHPNALSSGGDDFYALRPYVVGDDLRHVHWRSTARRDDLMVRQDEMPWQGRATILLDTRAGAHTDTTFERAVSAAASIVVASSRRRFLLRLVTTDGQDSGVASGQAHVDRLLATVALDERGSVAAAANALRRSPHGGGAVAMLLGGAHGADSAGAPERLGRGIGHCTIVVFRDGAGVGPRRGVHVVDEEHPFAAVWRTAMGGRRVGAIR